MTAAAVIVAAAPFVLLTGSSGADTSTATGGWYWAGQPGAQPPPIGQPPTLPSPDVPDGDVAAGYRPTGVDKETFLHLATDVGEGTSVTSVVLTIKEDQSGGVNAAADQAKINAKLVTDFWLDGAAATSIDQAPKFDDTPSVAGVRAADGTWTFDLTPIAQQWAGGTPNNGVGLIPDQTGGTFQVVWKLDSASVDVEASAAPSSSGSSSSADTSGGLGATGATSGTGGDSGAVSSDNGASSGAGTGSLGGDTATIGSPNDAVAGAPSTATPSTPAPAGGGQQVAVSPRTKRPASHGAPPLGFFVAGLAALGLLGVVGVTLGDAGEPALPREGSVVRRLERRTAES